MSGILLSFSLKFAHFQLHCQNIEIFKNIFLANQAPRVSCIFLSKWQNGTISNSIFNNNNYKIKNQVMLIS